MGNNFPECRVIGMCGRSGSGKTTVCKAFERLGAVSIDTDGVYRELTHPEGDGTPSPLVKRIAREFGDAVVFPDGSLNRKALSEAVFGDGKRENLGRLNTITHKPILDRTAELIEEYAAMGIENIIVDAPALFESGFDEKCDSIICVSVPDDVLVERIVARDSVSEDAARRRLSSQTDDSALRERSDFVIENDGNTDLDEAARAVLEKILI